MSEARTEGAIVITREGSHETAGQELMRRLSVELAARYPEDPLEGGAGYDAEAAHTEDGACFLVARVDGTPVGCGAVRPLAPGVGEVKRMYVIPEMRGRGIALRLVDALEDFARDHGYARLRLQTAVRQPEALGLYARAGYARIPCYGPYTDDPLSVCFEKQLGMILRPATPEDAPKIAALLDQLGHPISAETVVRQLALLSGSDGDRVLVAARDGRVLGVMALHWASLLHRDRPLGRITVLVVDEAARGQGIGRRLVAEAERVLRAAGCSAAEVTSNVRRAAAHDFYRGLGYGQPSAYFRRSLEE